MSLHNHDDYTRLKAGDGTLLTQTGGALDVNATISISSQKVDDASFTPSVDSVSMIGCTFDDNTPDTVDEGDAGAVRMTSDRAMHISLRDAAGNNRGANVDANYCMQVDISNQSADLTVAQSTHDDLNCNANMQISNTDLSFGQATMSNSLPVTISSNQSYPEVQPDAVNNLWDGVGTNAGGDSASIDTRYASQISIFGSVNGVTTLDVYFSSDDATFYKSSHSYVSAGSEDVEMSFQSAARYIRVKSSNDVTATMILCAKK